jgi:replicative DNA helicase
MNNPTQTLPQALDAERGLIGSMLLAPDRVISEFVERGSDEFFHHPAHQTIYRHMLQMWTNRKGVNLITLTQSLEDSGLLEGVGGAAYVTELFNFVQTATGAKYYADVLREKWIARKAIMVATEIQEAAYNPAEHPDLENRVQQGLVQIASMFESKAKIQTMGELILRALDRYEENHKNGGGLVGLGTGIAPFDKATRGLKPGEMITIAAPTKGGKSALALNIGMHNGLAGIPVGIFSLEMSADELTDRLIAAHGNVDMCAMTDGGFSQRDITSLTRAAAELSNTPIIIRDEAIMSPLQFRAAVRKLVAQHKCKLIIVDYLQLMEPSNRTDSRERQVAECSRTIKTTAGELGIPIIVLTQLNDDGRSRESRAIEQDSNIFAVIEEDQDGHYINLKYTRSCPRTRIPVTFRREFTRFEES